LFSFRIHMYISSFLLLPFFLLLTPFPLPFFPLNCFSNPFMGSIIYYTIAKIYKGPFQGLVDSTNNSI
jgi:hypothetical protein